MNSGERFRYMLLVITVGAMVLIAIFRPALCWAVLCVLFLTLIITRGNTLYKQKRKLDKQNNELNITNIEKGGVFKLTGVGENSDEWTLNVLAKHLYREGDYCWYELECDRGEGDKVFVDVEVDDYVMVSVVLEKLTMKDIKLSASLDKIDDDENGNVKYRQKTFWYKESDNAVFYRFCDDKKSEKFYYWDFENVNNSISIEKWGSNDYQVYYCQKMKPSQVTVLSNKGI